MARRWGLSVSAIVVLLLQQACSAFHITFVVSVCRETQLQFLDGVFDALAAGPVMHSTDILFYCKCTQNVTATGRACMNLPNLGREVSTYLSFMTEFYKMLRPSPTHLLMLVNGGTGSKKHATDTLIGIAQTLAKQTEAPAFIDGGGMMNLSPADRLDPTKVKRFPGNNVEFLRKAKNFCFKDFDGENPLPDDVVRMQPPEARCPCQRGPRYCELFPPAVCPDGQKLMFEDQLNCSWIGHSRENYADNVLHNGQYDKNLLPADRTTNFMDWLFDRWGVNADTWESIFWQCCGNLGISTEVMFERPRSVYRAAFREMTTKGISGGIAVMYYERAWRSIFALPAAERAGRGEGGRALASWGKMEGEGEREDAQMQGMTQQALGRGLLSFSGRGASDDASGEQQGLGAGGEGTWAGAAGAEGATRIGGSRRRR